MTAFWLRSARVAIIKGNPALANTFLRNALRCANRNGSKQHVAGILRSMSFCRRITVA